MLPVLVYREAAVGYRDLVQNLVEAVFFLEPFAIPRLLASVVAFSSYAVEVLLCNCILAAVDASISHITGS